MYIECLRTNLKFHIRFKMKNILIVLRHSVYIYLYLYNITCKVKLKIILRK